MAAGRSDFTEKIRVVWTDMWRPYLIVGEELTPRNANILNRFHVIPMFGRFLDRGWIADAARLGEEGRPALLSRIRRYLPERRENLREKQGAISRKP